MHQRKLLNCALGVFDIISFLLSETSNLRLDRLHMTFFWNQGISCFIFKENSMTIQKASEAVYTENILHLENPRNFFHVKKIWNIVYILR